MVNELVIHIGDCKTGSTSIQNTLARNACLAGEKSLFYPAGNNHNALAGTLRNLKNTPPPEKSFQRLRRRLLDSNADIGIVSAEHFEFVDPRRLRAEIEKNLPEFATVTRVIAYVRPHGEQVMSRFVEQVKLGNHSGAIDSFYHKLNKRQRLQYTTRFRKWRQVFGDRFTLRPMVRSRLSQGDVVHDFFACVYGATAFSLKDFPHQNTAVSVEDLALLREMHSVWSKQLHSALSQANFGRRIFQAINLTPDLRATKPRLPRKLAEQVARDFRQDAAQLDAEFFEGTPISDGLQKSIEIAVQAPQSFEAADYFSPETLRVARLSARALISVMADRGAAEGRRARRLAKKVAS